MKFRNLKACEIDIMPKIVKQNGCMVLLYKDARCDQNILDKTVGPMSWKRTHQLINNNLFCTVEVYDSEKKEWVGKQDVGVESFTEKVKGQASDSFKRACYNWGIGRELYTAPFIWIQLRPEELKQYKGKYVLDKKVKFNVKEIKTVDGKIENLTIADQTGKIRFKTGGGPTKTGTNVTQEHIAGLKRDMPIWLNEFHGKVYLFAKPGNHFSEDALVMFGMEKSKKGDSYYSAYDGQLKNNLLTMYREEEEKQNEVDEKVIDNFIEQEENDE